MTEDIVKTAERETYSVMSFKRGGKFVCYCTKIGYIKNSSGKRIQAWQYHGKSYSDAQKAALQIADKWEAIHSVYRKARTLHNYWVRQTLAAAALDGYYLDDNDQQVPYAATPKDEKALRERLAASAPALPIWGKDALKKNPEAASTTGPQTITLTEAVERFIQTEEVRVGRQSKGLKFKSFHNKSRNIRLAIKGNGKGEGRPIDPQIQVGQLTRQIVQSMVNWWLSSERDITERAAANYLRDFKQVLDELGRVDVGYPKPQIDDLFTFSNQKGEVIKYDKAVVKALLDNSPTNATRLYQLLALNCGFYPVDVCHLRPEEIVEFDGETFIARQRDKTSHQNDFTTLWWLFPETAKLLKANMEKSGTFALVRPDGRPMYPQGKSKTSETYPATQFNVARTAAAKAVPTHAEAIQGFQFKQFRKIGFTAIKRITVNPEIARMYAAKVVADAEYDRDDFFEPLTDALKKWHKELRADKVI